ncbi:MAG: hypothetical protein RBU37_19515 [Myxococcota bacterium]|nr:hypothetical protein [Myxococcota bacterium]
MPFPELLAVIAQDENNEERAVLRWLHPHRSLGQGSRWLRPPDTLQKHVEHTLDGHRFQLEVLTVSPFSSLAEADGGLQAEGGRERLLHLSRAGDLSASAALYRLGARSGDAAMQLQALLALPPNPAVWQALLRVLDQASDALHPGVLCSAAFAPQLESWPLALRKAPTSWWQRCCHGNPPAAWGWMRTLRLWSQDAQSWQTLCEGSAANPIALLRLHGLQLTRPQLAQLARSRSLTQLRELECWGMRLSASAVIGLLSGALLGRLHTLRLRDCGIDDEGAALLARSELLRSVQVLDLGSNRISSAGAISMARSPHLSELGCLELGGNPIATEGLRALHSSVRLREGALRLSPLAAGR